MRAKWGWVLLLLLGGLLACRTPFVTPHDGGDDGGSGAPAAAAPVVFFTDLTDAPTSGWAGRADRGAAVTVWGLGFGSERGDGYVTVGGVDLLDDGDYAEWGAVDGPRTARGLERITFWLNPRVPLGDVEITVTVGGRTSRALPFHARTGASGRLLFLRPDGSDAADGRSPATAWKTFRKVNELQPGDVLYVMGGTYGPEHAARDDRFVDTYNFDRPGQKGRSIAVVGYPGQAAVLGRCDVARFVYGGGEGSGRTDLSHWTFAKLQIQVEDTAFYLGNNGKARADFLRIVGNDATSCDATPGHGTVFQIEANAGLRDLRFLGNYVHHAGKPLDWREGDGSRRRPYGLYMGGWGRYEGLTEVAYNEFAYNNGRAAQFYGHYETDVLEHLSFHHDWVHHTDTPPFLDDDNVGSPSVVFGGGDPARADYAFLLEADVYDNLFSDNSGGVRIGAAFGGGQGGVLRFFHNTQWGCGYMPTFSDLSFGNGRTVVTANVFRTREGDNSSGYSDWQPGADGPVAGGYNLYWGLGRGVPQWDDAATSREAPPELVDPAAGNFDPGPGSPARDAVPCLEQPTDDYLGRPRPLGAGCDAGAFEAAD